MPAFFKTDVTVFFGGIVTSRSPFRAVAVWAKISLLIHSMVSPTLAVASAGDTTRFSITTCRVAACAGTAIAPSIMAVTIRIARPGSMAFSLLQAGSDVFGVLLVALKDFQAGLQQALQFGIAGRGDQLRLQRAIDGLVVGDLVGDIGLVVVGALQLVELGELVGGLLRQRL